MATPSTATGKVDMREWQNGGLTSFSQTCFAEYWDELPQILAEDEQGNTRAAPDVDPYNFQHRMALGKILIENTGGAAVWGKGCGMHFFWGYLAQLDWQWRSGRLASPTATATRHQHASTSSGKNDDINDNESDCKISTDAWFGYMNLNFSIAVYRGAARAGLVPDISLCSAESGFDVEADPGFIKCVDIWESFWRGPHETFLAQLSVNCASNDKSNEKESSKKQHYYQQAIDDLYRELWSSHTQVITSSLPQAKRLEELMPDFERKFGLGWCHMVELLAAMKYTLLSLDALMEHGAGYLPSRILDDGNINMNWLLKNRKDEYNGANQMMDLHKATPRQMSAMCGFYRRLCRWEGERQQMPVTIKILTKEGEASLMKKLRVIGRMLVKAILPKCC